MIKLALLCNRSDKGDGHSRKIPPAKLFLMALHHQSYVTSRKLPDYIFSTQWEENLEVGDHVKHAGLLFREDCPIKARRALRDVLEILETTSSWMSVQKMNRVS
jgi:hypothetical protein